MGKESVVVFEIQFSTSLVGVFIFDSDLSRGEVGTGSEGGLRDAGWAIVVAPQSLK